MVKVCLYIVRNLTLALIVSLPAQAISIEQAWEQAKKHDPDYEKAKIDVKFGSVGIDASRSSLLPSLGAAASVNWNDSTNSVKNYGASVSQVIWDSSLWSNFNQSKANYVKARLQLSQSRNSLAMRLLSSYLDVASAQEDLQLAQSKLEEGHKLLKIIEQRYLAGKVKSVDVEEIRATQVFERMNILSAQANLAEKRAELAALVNQRASHVNQISMDLLSKPLMLVDSKGQWQKTAKENSPERLVALQNIRVLELAKEATNGGYYPVIKGNIEYSDNDQLQDGEVKAALTLTIPLDINGAIRAKVDEASLDILAARQELHKVEIDINKRVSLQFDQVGFSWNQVLVANELVTSREKVLRSKEKLYNAGLLEVSEVISAHNLLFQTKNNLQNNLYHYWRQRIGLLQVAGRLEDDTIIKISRVFTS